MMRAALHAFLPAMSVIIAAALAAAQPAYPTHPLTMIVPFPAGGGVDAVARIVADKLGALIGQPIIIGNRGGAGGVIGTRLGAKAAPDGYTLVMADSGTTSIDPSLYGKPGYDPRRDFVPIGLIAATPIVLMAHPSFPARTVADVIALAKTDPDKIALGTPAPGTVSYLTGELFKATAGLAVTIVPYKGTAALTNDLIGNHVSVGFNVLAPAMGSITSGNLRVIAVAGAARSPLLHDVPTFAESGLPGFESVLHYGLLAPAGIPKERVAWLNGKLKLALESPDVRRRLAAEGSDLLGSTPDEYAADIDREETKWSALIRKLNLKVE